MITFTNTVRVNRAIEDVYAYLSDLEHTPEWNWAITETRKITPGPRRVGSRYQQTRSVPRHATEILEITALEENRLVEVRGTLASFGAYLIYRLHSTGSGTEIANAVRLEPSGALQLAAPLLGARIGRSVAHNLGQLRINLERRASE